MRVQIYESIHVMDGELALLNGELILHDLLREILRQGLPLHEYLLRSYNRCICRNSLISNIVVFRALSVTSASKSEKVEN